MKKHVNYNFLEGVCCYFNCGDKTILGKKTSDIGIGLWDGYGGKIKHKETPEEAGVRELREEAEVFVLPKHLKKVGEIYFHNTRYGKIIFTFKVHIFFVIQWGGYPKETEEMKSPTEFLKDKLPYKKNDGFGQRLASSHNERGEAPCPFIYWAKTAKENRQDTHRIY